MTTEAPKNPSPRSQARDPLLPKAWDLPQEFRDRMGDEVGRQRAMVADGHLLLILHTPPEPGQAKRFGRVFWRDNSGQWKPTGIKHDQTAVGELLAEYEAVLRKIEELEGLAESAHDYFGILTRLNPLVRSMHNAYEAIKDARKQLPTARELILLRDEAYDLTRRAELLQADTKSTLDFIIARRAEDQAKEARRQTRSAHRLNVLAALFFPIATISAVLGMKLGHGLEKLDALNAPLPLLVVLGTGLVLGVVLTLLINQE